MEPQAALQCLHLYSPDPLQAARFYSGAYGMAMSPEAGAYVCRGPGRELRLSEGPANQLRYAHYALADAAAWEAFAARVQGLPQQTVPAGFTSEALALKDPDGNLVVFTPPAAPDGAQATALPPATLQHFALRTPNLPAMLAFYTEQLGFVLSDAVKDPDGNLVVFTPPAAPDGAQAPASARA